MKIAIIGSGPAGITAAKTLRQKEFQGEILMFSGEKSPPYAPAALGRYLIEDDEDILYWQGKNICSKLNIKHYAGEKVIEVMPDHKLLRTEVQREVQYDKLLIASGSSLKISEALSGYDKAGLLNFKNLEATRRVKELAEAENGSAVIVGGGFIGVEIALCLTELGIEPTVLNRRGWIMPRLLDKETGAYVVEDLEKKGVNVRLNTEGSRIMGEKEITGVETSSGDIITGDLYIAATGVQANTDFIQNSGIKYASDGIPVNKLLQTNYQDVYACGDVAKTRDFLSNNLKSHGLHPVAVKHASTAAKNMLGKNIEYERMVSMNSLKELSYKMIVVGMLEGEVIKENSDEYFRKLYLQDDKIVGFVLLGDITNSGLYLSLLKRQSEVTEIKDELISPRFNNYDLLTKYSL